MIWTLRSKYNSLIDYFIGLWVFSSEDCKKRITKTNTNISKQIPSFPILRYENRKWLTRAKSLSCNRNLSICMAFLSHSSLYFSYDMTCARSMKKRLPYWSKVGSRFFSYSNNLPRFNFSYALSDFLNLLMLMLFVRQ